MNCYFYANLTENKTIQFQCKILDTQKCVKYKNFVLCLKKPTFLQRILIREILQKILIVIFISFFFSFYVMSFFLQKNRNREKQLKFTFMFTQKISPLTRLPTLSSEINANQLKNQKHTKDCWNDFLKRKKNYIVSHFCETSLKTILRQ